MPRWPDCPHAQHLDHRVVLDGLLVWRLMASSTVSRACSSLRLRTLRAAVGREIENLYASPTDGSFEMAAIGAISCYLGHLSPSGALAFLTAPTRHGVHGLGLPACGL
jgi:hypothetical protein